MQDFTKMSYLERELEPGDVQRLSFRDDRRDQPVRRCIAVIRRVFKNQIYDGLVMGADLQRMGTGAPCITVFRTLSEN